MNHGRIAMRVIPLVIGIGLSLSACAATPVYGSPDYAYHDGYTYDPYGSVDLYGHGDWGHGHTGWGHDHEGRGGFGHAGLNGYGGAAGHGGGHGGGGHR